MRGSRYGKILSKFGCVVWTHSHNYRIPRSKTCIELIPFETRVWDQMILAKKERISLKGSVLFCVKLLNKSNEHRSIATPTNRGGNIHDELNGELFYYRIQSDDVLREIVEFI